MFKKVIVVLIGTPCNTGLEYAIPAQCLESTMRRCVSSFFYFNISVYIK